MQFWSVIVYNKLKLKEENFYVRASHDQDCLIEILTEVHPEWEKIKAKKVKRPAEIKEPLA
jgi:hypothetical protein